MSLLDREQGDWTAMQVRDLRKHLRAFADAENPGTQAWDVMLAGARRYRKRPANGKEALAMLPWSREAIEIAMADGAQLGGGWIVREIPGRTWVLTFIRC